MKPSEEILAESASRLDVEFKEWSEKLPGLSREAVMALMADQDRPAAVLIQCILAWLDDNWSRKHEGEVVTTPDGLAE